MTARRKYKRGKPNSLPGPLLPPEGTDWGAAMKALPSDRHRAFVLALYQVSPGHGANVKAAKLAGFGTSRSSPESWSSIAYALAHDERVQEAIHEMDQKMIRAAAPRALRAMVGLIEDPEHKDHARAIGMALDRTHPVQTVHTVNVNQRKTVVVTTAEVLDRINQLARQAGILPDQLPPMIDVTPPKHR